MSVDTCGSLALVLLSHAAYSRQQVAVAAKHQFHKASHLVPLLLLSCTVDSPSQIPDSPVNWFPIDVIPVSLRSHRSDIVADSIFHEKFGSFTLI